MLQLQPQINKSFSIPPTKLSEVIDELLKRTVQPWTLQAAACNMKIHIRSGINGQVGEVAYIIIHARDLNSLDTLRQVTVLSQNLDKEKDIYRVTQIYGSGESAEELAKLWKLVVV